MSVRPLDAAWTRVNWAAKSLEVLKQNILATEPWFRDPEVRAVTTTGYVDTDGKHWVVVIDTVRSLDPLLGVLAAEIVQHFRSALDYLAFELSFVDAGGEEIITFRTRGGQTASTNIAFPLITRGTRAWRECAKKFDSDCPRYLPGVTVRHRAMIKRHQPYQRWDGKWGHPLAMLADLDNDNKHRLVQPVATAPYEYRLGPDYAVRDCELLDGKMVEVVDITNRPLEPQTVLARFPIRVTRPNPYVKVPAEGDIYVGFRDGRAVLDVLREMRDKVSLILLEFGPIFKTAKAKRVWRPRPGRITPPSKPPKRTRVPL